MKTNILIVLFLGLFAFTSCSKDDPKPTPNPPKNELIGTWQVNEIKFTEFEDKGFPANDGCMIVGIYGYDFKEGGDFGYILADGSPFGNTKGNWSWKDDSDKKNFSIIQKKGAAPYDFGIIADSYTISEENGKTILKFSSKLANESIANFKLTKGTVDKTILPKIYLPDGTDFICQMKHPKNP